MQANWQLPWLCRLYHHLPLLPDATFAPLLRYARYVAVLRREEGFEMMGVEALLSGTRPLVFDNELVSQPYRWFKGHAVMVTEPTKQVGRHCVDRQTERHCVDRLTDQAGGAPLHQVGLRVWAQPQAGGAPLRWLGLRVWAQPQAQPGHAQHDGAVGRRAVKDITCISTRWGGPGLGHNIRLPGVYGGCSLVVLEV